MNAGSGPLPSPMRMVEEGDTRPEVKRLARGQCRFLRNQAIMEQAFAILWALHGTDDDRDRDLVWRWRNAFAWIAAAMVTYPRSQRNPRSIAEGFDSDWFADPLP